MVQKDHRLHLQDGPIDLIIEVDSIKEIRENLYLSAKKRLNTVLRELVSELDLLTNYNMQHLQNRHLHHCQYL